MHNVLACEQLCVRAEGWDVVQATDGRRLVPQASASWAGVLQRAVPRGILRPCGQALWHSRSDVMLLAYDAWLQIRFQDDRLSCSSVCDSKYASEMMVKRGNEYITDKNDIIARRVYRPVPRKYGKY